MSIQRRSCSLLLAAAMCGAASAQVRYVDASAPPNGNGTSWASAFNDLSVALDTASFPAVAEIWVREGRYVPRSGGFVLPDRVSVYGGFAGFETSPTQRDWVAHPTVLDGDVLGNDQPDWVAYEDNRAHVVVDAGGVRSHLDGFRVRGGRQGPGAGLFLQASEVFLANLEIAENRTIDGPFSGGGAEIRATRAELRGCVVRDNHATGGGGVRLNRVDEMLVSGCRFEDNSATGGAALDAIDETFGFLRVESSHFEDNESGSGAGIDIDAEVGGAVEIDGCTFVNNTASSGAGVSVYAQVEGTVDVVDCVFRGNSATTGGGIYLKGEGSPPMRAAISGSTFEGNGVCAGGGIYAYWVPLVVTTSTFRESRLRPQCGVGTGGGGIRARGESVRASDCAFSRSDNPLVMLEGGSSATLERCTLSNVGDGAPAVRLSRDETLDLKGSIVRSDAAEPILAHSASVVTASFSNARKNGAALPGAGNVDVDPLFVDALASDLRLAPGSPCIDAGDPSLVHVGPDLAGFSRLTDGDLDGVLRVDIGAREASPVRLVVTGTPAVGSTIGIHTLGRAGLPTQLWIARPGQRFLPRTGTLFLAATGVLRATWPSAPSSVQVVVPPGLSGEYHLQEIVFLGGARALSNYVRMEL